MQNYVILFLISLICSRVSAQEQNRTKELSQQTHWLRLLHYNRPLFTASKSDVTNASFFLSPAGATDPQKELEASIEGLNSEEAYCRFPARRMWLEKQGYVFKAHQCQKFQEWTRLNSVKSASLIFATGFLGNPASFFGHPLLKFNFKDERSPLDLLDTAINYGAFTPKEIGAFAYAIRGIFGDFDAGFTAVDFFFHKNNYSELELRDMWEYELKLERSQLDELVAHVWEMEGAKIGYYFFSDNCAYRMSDLLELATDKEVVRKIPVAIPISLFHRLEELNLLAPPKLIPSRQTRLRQKVASLNSAEFTELKAISNDVNHATSDEFKKLDEEGRMRVLETSMDYFAFRFIGDTGNEFQDKKKIVLKERFLLPAKKFDWRAQPQSPPHEAQKPILTHAGYFYSPKFHSGMALRLRPVAYDYISPDAGRPAYSSLALLDLELNATDDRVWIRNFNLVSIENMNVSRTHLAGDGGFAWRVNAGADQLNLSCNDCTVTKLEAGIGQAWELSSKFLFSAMLDPRLQSQFEQHGLVNLRPNVGLLVTPSEAFRLNFTYGRRFYFTHQIAPENLLSAEARLGRSKDYDLRISYQEHVEKRYSAAVSLFW